MKLDTLTPTFSHWLQTLYTDLTRFPWLSAGRTLAERFREDRLGLTASSLTFTTTIALVPLVVWMVYGVLRLAAGDYGFAVHWVSDPLNATLVVLTFAISFWHMHAGVRVVVEDYIHKTLTKTALLLINLFICGLAGALAIFAILKVALSGGAL